MIGGRAGSFQRRETWLNATDNWSGVNVNFALNYATVRGDSDRVVTADAQSQTLPGANPSASLAPGSLATDIEHWNAHLNFSSNSWDLALFSWN